MFKGDALKEPHLNVVVKMGKDCSEDREAWKEYKNEERYAQSCTANSTAKDSETLPPHLHHYNRYWGQFHYQGQDRLHRHQRQLTKASKAATEGFISDPSLYHNNTSNSSQSLKQDSVKSNSRVVKEGRMPSIYKTKARQTPSLCVKD